MDRIKFFSVYDLSTSFYLDELGKKLDEFDESRKYSDINDILELKNIESFIVNNIFHKNWTEEKIEEYRNKIKKFPEILRRFFNRITDNNIVNEISKVDRIYIEDFWELFCNYKIYKNISRDEFKNILNLENFYINDVLEYQELVRYYDDVLKEYLFVNNDKSVELYLSEFFEEKDYNQKKLFFPPSLTKEEKEKQLDSYVTEDINKFNYFQLILKSSSCQELGLSPILKKNTKEVYERLLDNYFSNQPSLGYDCKVSFQSNQKKSIIINRKKINGDYIIEIKYNLDWINNNLDYPTLLNNFIYLFEFTDNNFIFTNINYKNEFGFFEKFMKRQSKKEYKTGLVFELKKSKTEMDLIGYYKVLKENGIRLEKVLEWFFKEYLLNEFGIKNFIINLPSENLSYLEKCKCIFGEIEKAVKQFSLYVDYKEIDNEILELLTNQISFESIKSLLNKKYIYINTKNQTTINILFYLFSNQSDLRFIKNIKSDYENFVQVIYNEKINKSMLSEVQLQIVKFLLKENIIQETENGDLTFDLELINILRILNEKKVLCINYFRKWEKKIEFLKNKNMIYYDNTLLSKKESEYLNYYLNSKFSNGLELRNKYAHGTYPLNEEQYFMDYFKFLEILILIIIKINEEFCLYDELKNDIKK